MAFQLSSVVPWGRNLNEYRLMFQLNDFDMTKKIAGFVQYTILWRYIYEE